MKSQNQKLILGLMSALALNALFFQVGSKSDTQDLASSTGIEKFDKDDFDLQVRNGLADAKKSGKKEFTVKKTNKDVTEAWVINLNEGQEGISDTATCEACGVSKSKNAVLGAGIASVEVILETMARTHKVVAKDFADAKAESIKEQKLEKQHEKDIKNCVTTDEKDDDDQYTKVEPKDKLKCFEKQASLIADEDKRKEYVEKNIVELVNNTLKSPNANAADLWVAKATIADLKKMKLGTDFNKKLAMMDNIVNMNLAPSLLAQAKNQLLMQNYAGLMSNNADAVKQAKDKITSGMYAISQNFVAAELSSSMTVSKDLSAIASSDPTLFAIAQNAINLSNQGMQKVISNDPTLKSQLGSYFTSNTQSSPLSASNINSSLGLGTLSDYDKLFGTADFVSPDGNPVASATATAPTVGRSFSNQKVATPAIKAKANTQQRSAALRPAVLNQ